jgi:serine/threonine protein kinase/tetratricopeptide (TPR) repeat protein
MNRGGVAPSATIQVAGAFPPLPIPNLVITPAPVRDLSRSSLFNDIAEHGPQAVMPRPGDTFLGFRLIEELGRGSFARVFLANQQALSDREVVLKISLRPTREAERLARLQHTNIVPVYSVHNATPVQAICMPYLGRQTIGDLLQTHRKSHQAAGLSTRKAVRTRRASTTTVGRPAGASPSGSQDSMRMRIPLSGAPPAGDLVGNTRVVLQILAELAAGLDHAHQRGILHLDLKPANVLLADTGEPMLLDFNLSVDATEKNREMVGGTIPYMAPEQLIDLRSRGRGQIDARSDLYSLGVMAYEMLTGTVPFPLESRGLSDFEGLLAARHKCLLPLREANPDVSPALASIVRKLLAPDPGHRYQTAADLREDLERQLADRPLRFARDRSPIERVGKWRRRHPRSLLVMGLVVALTLAGGSFTLAYHHAEARAAAEGEARARRSREALETTRLDLILPGAADRSRGISRANELLSEFGLPGDPNWRHRAAFRQIPTADRVSAAENLGEFLLLLAHARWEESRGQNEPRRRGVARELLRLNSLAEGCFEGTAVPPFLYRQRAALAAVVGDPAPAETPRGASNARDHFLDGVDAITAGRFANAADSLERTIAAQPDHAAAQFCLGFRRQQRGEFERAAERYDMARVLMPNDLRPFFQRGVIFALQDRHEESEVEFSRVLEIDPVHVNAYINRGWARMGMGKYGEAESDFTAAIEKKAPPVWVHTLRAQARDGLHDSNGAKADRAAASEMQPVTEEDYLARGEANLATNPTAALDDFRAAERVNPRSLHPLKNQIHVLADCLQDEPLALETVTRAVELYPNHKVFRVGRSIILARMGRREEAHREAERVQPTAKESLLTFQLSCVYALTSRTHPDDRIKAFTLLRQAVRDGFHDTAILQADRNLAPIREFPDFKAILVSIRYLFL